MHFADVSQTRESPPTYAAARSSREAEAMMPDSGSVVRVAAVGDLHCSKNSQGLIRPLFENAEQFADVLVLCGDLTDYGLPEEAHLLVEELSVASKLPIVAVLGNHDFESGREDEVRQILVDAGLILLDGDAVEIKGIGFAGARGFAGGFGRGTLGSWGEKRSRPSSRRRSTRQ